MIKLKKINDIHVKPIKKNINNLPVKGSELFTEPYCNIFLCAKKKSGKSTVIYNIIKKCITRQTHVFIFASTAYSDITYKRIMEYLNIKSINYDVYTALKEEGENIIRSIISELNENAQQKQEEEDEEEEERGTAVEQPKIMDYDNNNYSVIKTAEKIKKPKKKTPKYLVPEYLFIFDDLGATLRDTSIDSLLKVNRHYKSKVLISSQYLNDLSPQARLQLDYMLIFKGMPFEKLQQIYKDVDLSIDFETYLNYYNYATDDKYNFLYIDVRNEEYRKNFNTKFLSDLQK